MAMHADGQLNYPFGRVDLKVDVTGSKSPTAASELLDALTAATCVQITQQGIAGISTQMQGEATSLPYDLQITSGDVTIKWEVNFELKQHVSKTILNQSVFGYIVPQFSEVVAKHFGDGQAAPQVSMAEAKDGLGVALGTRRSITAVYMEPDTDLAGDRRSRQRQPATH